MKILMAPLFLIISLVHSLAGTMMLDSAHLQPKSYYGEEAKLVVQILDTYHFKRMKLDDSLSSIILDGYLETLDNNKSYFLKSDIQNFEKYRKQIDNLVKAGDLSFAYDIYNIFAERFHNRMNFVNRELLVSSFDYTKDEYYDTDREELPWAQSEAELDDLWRKIVKSQALNLKLNGQEDAQINQTITKRYERFEKAINQYTSEDVFELFMNTVAEAYDPHTNYFSPRTSDRFQQSMSLSLEGIGARLQTENDYTKVVQIVPGGPADKSDLIHEDDRIIGVAQGEDGEMVDVIGWRIDDVVDLIKGPKGTVVRLQILPAESGVEGPSEEIQLVREKITLEDQKAQARVINHEQNGKKFKIGVIQLPSFYMDFDAYQRREKDYTSTTRDVKNLIGELKEQDIDGIIMDLRDNGGGSLSEAIDLTGLFIKNGPVVQVRYPNEKIDLGEDEDPSVIYDGPMAVMINRFSASASEIFAAAIQDYKRGVVIGEQSYGKGTVQSVIDLSRYLKVPEGEQVGQLKLTLQKFYRVTGSSTQHLGVTPDIDLPSAFDAEEFGESSNASALPWDQIRATRYMSTDDVSSDVLNRLNSDYQQRLTSDVELRNLVAETTELKNNLNKTRVSLNYDERKREMEEAEKRRAARNSMKNTRIDPENQISEEIESISDKYLREGVIILSDYIDTIG
ncbi:carboxy terminal-processing peptidase [Fulvivirga sedimenti]|uniref:Carboxy terminal-processing peptidase n=1 Tax=Fulvivirga sedimenti TaxID=2879465 RepID=A0A9X1HVY6_9BACT|nr:carboxy terminal-processing peptidase [Fulvivirga sedimenti]MCA6078861.1 carboxy terminal-processing peptidase [Fulvivirga sedimenti]